MERGDKTTIAEGRKKIITDEMIISLENPTGST